MLIAENLAQFAPRNRLYQVGEQYVLVVKAGSDIILPDVVMGMRIEKTMEVPVDVFLCDENAVLIDADGDPANGMTPLLTLDHSASFDDAVVAAEKALV